MSAPAASDNLESLTKEELIKKLRELQKPAAPVEGDRKKIDKMSEEVNNENPYSRLLALKRMGIVPNYEA